MKFRKSQLWLKLSVASLLLFCTAPVFAQNSRRERIKPPFPFLQFARQSRGDEAVGTLGARLPEVAAWYGKTVDEFARLLRRDRTLWLTRTGRLMYVCELEAPLEAEPEVAEGTRPDPGNYPLDQTFKLHSMASSNKTIYLDFDGGTVSGTAWNTNYNGGSPIVAAPYDIDGNPASFSAAELQRIQNIWRRVAEDYAPFDVDVTTEPPPPEALTRSSSSDVRYGNTVMITPTNFYPNAGGVSYIGSFDDIGDNYKVSWVFSNKLSNAEKYIAEAASHENGHAVGLHHEGTTGGTVYYQGHGDWAPIMGNSYYRNITQWSQGEYSGANNLEDQLEVMQNYGLAYYPDDHGNTHAAATALAGGSSLTAYGFIERNTDIDVFSFACGAGTVSLDFVPAQYGPNLKIMAELRDSAGNLIATSSLAALGGSMSVSVPAGTYYITVAGIGAGDPLTTGYSNYASLGQYQVFGSIPASSSLAAPTGLRIN